MIKNSLWYNPGVSCACALPKPVWQALFPLGNDPMSEGRGLFVSVLVVTLVVVLITAPGGGDAGNSVTASVEHALLTTRSTFNQRTL